MPAAYAHYIFGKKVYHRLPKDIQQIIRENPEGYWLGLHGPDLLFYYYAVKRNRVSQQGYDMHQAPALPFFEKGRKNYQAHPSYVLLSYLLGFLCHFTLDSECHPYIGMYMEEKGVSHSEIETDFDRSLIEETGYDPVCLDTTRHLKREQETEEKISTMFDHVSSSEVDHAIWGFHFYLKLLRCKSPVKEKLMRACCDLIDPKRELSGMIMHGRKNMDCRESTVFLRERLNRAVPVAVELIERYVSEIDTGEPLPDRLNRNYE